MADLARQMIKSLGLRAPDEDIELVYTGLAPGEKLHEELVSDGDEVAPTHHDGIRVLSLPSGRRTPTAGCRRWRPASRPVTLTYE